MSNSDDTREHLEAQICELEILQSAYPDELKISDHGNVADMNDYVSGKSKNLPRRLEYFIKLSIPEGSAEFQVNLPLNYPKERPEIYVRSSSFDRVQQTKINEDLFNFMLAQELDSLCVYSLVTWTQENIDRYVRKSTKKVEKNATAKKTRIDREDSIFNRYWIYSHHIYSTLKRKDIVDLALENSLTGFCLAGKPGIICIEGTKADCEYWWQKIKVMNWQKILVRLIEDEDLCNNNLEDYRKFTGFREISFPASEKHNDMGQLLNYLKEHDCQYVFKELFGLERKTLLSSE